MIEYIPTRGDIVMLARRRLVLVLSLQNYNSKVGSMLVCPITSQRKDYPFEVATGPRAKTRGVILADHIKSLDWRAQRVKFVEKAYPDTVNEVLGKLKVLLD